jgi:hypothetical protein
MAGGGLLVQPSYVEDLTFPAYQDRLLMKSLGVQAGVVESEDYKVSAGTGLQVNVKKGKAFVEQTKAIEESSNIFYNGLYNVLNPIEQNPYNNVEVSSVNPQIAQIILRVYDVGELKTGGSSYARLEWLNGSPNAGATEAKMKEEFPTYEGAAALPTSSLRLAYVLVPKNATKSSEFYIQDARYILSKWPLNLVSHEENVEAKVGEMLHMEGGVERTVTLPECSVGSTIGVLSNATTKIKTPTGWVIEGDFIVAKETITLLSGQHVILILANKKIYRIIAGEPKREQKYAAIKAYTKSECEAGVEISASRPAFVGFSLTGGSLEIGGVVVTSGTTAQYYIPPGVKFKGTAEISVSVSLL